jgi:hypothetical protein
MEPMRLWTAIKLLAACFLVGLALAWLETSPVELMTDLWGTVQRLAATLTAQAARLLGSGSAAVGYVLTGAVVVIPLWLLFRLLDVLRGRR